MTYVPNNFECYQFNMNVENQFVQTYNSKN